ncbi:MAG: hypothetical protein L0Y74_00270, partial [candidate division Zixibacteria bacterium]|nr:hypothetical protein [candidate division Zixibacteria bacterium]
MSIMRSISILRLGLIVFLLCHSPVHAAEKSPPLILKHADQLETNLDNENLITNLNGNVWFTQGELDVKSKRAVWYKSAGQVVLIGSAVVQDSEHILKGERVIYYEKSGRAVATGDVSLWQF